MAGFILERAAGIGKAGSHTPVSFFLSDYWDNHACNVESAERIDIAIRHLTEHFGAGSVAGITAESVASYTAARRKGRIGRVSGDGTLRRELGVLVAALNLAAEAKRLPKADLPHIPMPLEPAGKDRWLTQAEARRLVDAANGRAKLFIQIALATASRKTAILKLTWFQVDLERRLINFNPEGRRQTKKRRVACPISDTLYPILVAAQAAKTSEFVLGDPGAVRTGFRGACRRAGLAKVTPHTLRHTWATWAAQSRVPMWEIAGVLGDTMATVEKKYAHHSPDYLRSAVNFNQSSNAEKGVKDGSC